MGVVARYMYWHGHDAAGTLPPLDVLVGVLTAENVALRYEWEALQHDETFVLVPPQWIGDWETGHPLAPGYQYIWRVPLASLTARPAQPVVAPYRPSSLPVSATGPRARDRAVSKSAYGARGRERSSA